MLSLPPIRQNVSAKVIGVRWLSVRRRTGRLFRNASDTSGVISVQLLSTTRTSINSDSIPFCETSEFSMRFRLSPRLYVQMQIESLGHTGLFALFLNPNVRPVRRSSEPSILSTNRALRSNRHPSHTRQRDKQMAII